MQRIDTVTKAADLFGAGKHGWRDGDPLTATPPTYMNAAIWNAIQEEIANAIEGLLGPLNGNDRTQLKQAILAAAAGKVSKTGDTMSGQLDIATAAEGAILRQTSNGLGAGGSHARLRRGDGTGKFAQLVSVGDGDNGLTEVQIRLLTAAAAISANFKFKESGRFELGTDPALALEAATKQYVDSAVISGVFGKGANYALVAADKNAVISFTVGGLTLTVPAANTFGSGWTFWVVNRADHAGDITLSSPSLFYGGVQNANSFQLKPGESARITSDGGAWLVHTNTNSVALATAAEAQAFTAGKIIDGAALNTALKGGNQSLATNGYQKLPGGLIVQWGFSAVTGPGYQAITFPITFPNACLSMQNSAKTNSAVLANNYSNVVSFSVTGATIGRDDQGSYWLAIGY